MYILHKYVSCKYTSLVDLIEIVVVLSFLDNTLMSFIELTLFALFTLLALLFLPNAFATSMLVCDH